MVLLLRRIVEFKGILDESATEIRVLTLTLVNFYDNTRRRIH